MRSMLESAEVLMALLSIGSQDGGEIETSGGHLDRALESLHGSLPLALSANLSYSTGSVGRRCLELSNLLHSAFYMEAARYGRSNSTIVANIPKDQAAEIAVSHGWRVADFINLGERLVAAAGQRSVA